MRKTPHEIYGRSPASKLMDKSGAFLTRLLVGILLSIGVWYLTDGIVAGLDFVATAGGESPEDALNLGEDLILWIKGGIIFLIALFVVIKRR